MKPDLYNFIANLAKDYGVEAAAEVAAFEAKHVYAVKEFVEKEGIDCDYTVTKAVDVQLDESHFNKLQDGYRRLIAGGSKATANARIIGAREAEAVCSIDFTFFESILDPLTALVLRSQRRGRLFHL